MRVDLPLAKNCGKSGLGHRAAGLPGRRASGPPGRWAVAGLLLAKPNAHLLVRFNAWTSQSKSKIGAKSENEISLKRRQSPPITRLYGINLGVQETRQITQLNSQKNSMFLTTWKPTKVICAKHGMLSTS